MNKKVIISFSVTIVLLLFLGVLSIVKMGELSGLTQKLYKHPLAVTNATINIKFHLASMHRYMKDVVLAENSEDIKVAIEHVNSSERAIYGYYNIIFEKYLGDMKDIKKSFDSFVKWKPIRDEVTFFMRDGKQNAAAAITKGKGAKHVALLNSNVDVLVEYANNKADYFLKNAIDVKNKTILITKIVLGIILFLIVAIMIALMRSLTTSERERIKKDKFIMRQSRLAQMGEMISMIAHQWRQPLSAIGIVSGNIRVKIALIEDNALKASERNFLNEKLDGIDEYVQVLSHTINDFRNFYKIDKELTESSITEPIKKALNIIRSTLEASGINIHEDYSIENETKVHEGEIMHVILNVLKNAQDKFKEENTINPEIRILTKDNFIEICDNGTKIKDDIIDNIFDPYFSTKDEKNGTGLGLYMCKTIVEEHHNGKFTVVNTDSGVCFKIEFS